MKRNISQQYIQAAAEAENMYFKSTRLESDKLYWEDMFTDLPEIISMSLKPFILDTDALVAATFTQNLSLGSTESIECFCKKHAVTEFQFSLACFVIVLQRYMGTEEVVIAVPVTTREQDQIPADGSFVNNVPFRYKINFRHTLEMHIQCFAQKWIEQFQHSMYPVNRVSEMIWKKHGKTFESICRTEFNYTTLHDGIDLKIPAKHAKKHLTMILTKSPSGFNIVCEFACEVLDPMMIERMTKTFSEMMTNIDTMPVLSNTLNTVEFLVEEELNLQNLFSKQAKTGENDKTAIQLFLENVQERPKNTAIVFKKQKGVI